MPEQGWGWIAWTLVVAGAVVALAVIQVVYLAIVLAWEDAKTAGLGYYGLGKAERDRFKKRLARHRRLLAPVLWVLPRLSRFTFAKGSFMHRGVSGPKGTCSEQSFAAADDYQPTPSDVFVVTQMKCGTTWMQHVVYEVLHRGQGDLVESDTTLYAVSPWLEARKSVPVDEAPLLGDERPSKVIKTHLPVELCPWSDASKYIYVARHPLSCFASCADFVATNLGAFTPPLEAVEEWFCEADSMWWTPWPHHVSGWWERSNNATNVLFVLFEDMKKDLAGVVERVVEHLGIQPLSADELNEVVRKCSFSYMQEHKHAFEMHPPHVLQTDANLFVSGKADRYKDVPAEMRERVLQWCAGVLQSSASPVAELYPDLDGARKAMNA